MVGTVFDGTIFYCAEFNSADMHRFSNTGSFIDTITISGATQLIDLAYDGQFVYGTTQTGTTMYKIDLTTQSVVSTFPLPQASYNIAYDADADSGNGGFWIGQWDAHLTLVDRTGSTIRSITPPESMLGIAWDNTFELPGYAGPFLWIFTGTSTGGQGIIKQIDLATDSLTPLSFNVATNIGGCIAGGLGVTTDLVPGYLTLYGMGQGDGPPEDFVFALELKELAQNVSFSGLQSNWNLVSIPFNQTVNITDVQVEYMGTNYTWADAVTNTIVDGNVFGWDRTLQSYVVPSQFVPGEGYWMFAYQPCTLWGIGIPVDEGNDVTSVKANWNLVGAPFASSINLTDLMVTYSSTDYTWAGAVSNTIIDGNVFGWNRGLQSYFTTTSFDPGDGYWLYAYQDCDIWR
jgi:hypothetical protein